MCVINQFTKGNPDGTCERCSTQKFYFAVGLKEAKDNQQICSYKSYWSDTLKAGVIITAAVIFLAITVFIIKKIRTSKTKVSLREDYVEA